MNSNQQEPPQTQAYVDANFALTMGFIAALLLIGYAVGYWAGEHHMLRILNNSL